MRKLATLMLGMGLAFGTAVAQTDQDPMNQNQDQSQTTTETETEVFEQESQIGDEDIGMPDTAANWLAMVLGGGALGAAGLGLRRR
jgi:hypothetical protein